MRAARGPGGEQRKRSAICVDSLTCSNTIMQHESVRGRVYGTSTGGAAEGGRCMPTRWTVAASWRCWGRREVLGGGARCWGPATASHDDSSPAKSRSPSAAGRLRRYAAECSCSCSLSVVVTETSRPMRNLHVESEETEQAQTELDPVRCPYASQRYHG